MKRTFIKVRRGILEPKHRRKLGQAWFLYFYMLDQADWNDGVIHEWTDETAADELDMPVTTLRKQRRHLEDELYIQCQQQQYCLEITILNYQDPRAREQGDRQGDRQGDQIRPPLHILQNTRIPDSQITRECASATPVPDEIADFIAVTGHKPTKIQIPIIIAAMQAIDRKDRREYLLPFWTEWAGVRAYKPTSLAWLTEWARDGTIPPQRKGADGKVIEEDRYKYIKGKFSQVGDY